MGSGKHYRGALGNRAAQDSPNTFLVYPWVLKITTFSSLRGPSQILRWLRHAPRRSQISDFFGRYHCVEGEMPLVKPAISLALVDPEWQVGSG